MFAKLKLSLIKGLLAGLIEKYSGDVIESIVDFIKAQGDIFAKKIIEKLEAK